jgi:hypothetical protein
VELHAVKESSVSTDQSLLNKLNQVKEPANLKQLLIEQSNPLFKSLTIKQRELDKVKNKMKTEIEHGGGASTAFNELTVLIEGLRTLISSTATSFGVTPEDLYSHQKGWEKKNTNTKTGVKECELSKPNTPGRVIMVKCTVEGLCPLQFYDIEVLYDLMNWSQGSKSTIHPSWLKDSALVFRVSKETEKKVKDIVSYCSESGWASSYTEKHTGGMIAFVWKSLSEAFQENDQLDDDDEENKSASSEDNSSDDDPTAIPFASSGDESNHAVSDAVVGGNKEGHVQSASSESEDDDNKMDEDKSDHEDENAEIVGIKEGHVQSASSESEYDDNKMDEEKSDHEDESKEEEIADKEEEDRSDEEQVGHGKGEVDDGKDEDGSDEEGYESEEAEKNEKNGGVSVNKAKRKRETLAVKQAGPARKSPRRK